jgi:hypothetical protein
MYQHLNDMGLVYLSPGECLRRELSGEPDYFTIFELDLDLALKRGICGKFFPDV